MDILKKISLLFILFLVIGIGCLALVNKDNDVNSLEKQIVVLVEERNAFENKYNNAVVELREKQNLIVILIQERDSYLSSRNEYYNQCQILTEQVTALENEKATLISEKETLQNTINANNDKISELNAKISSLNESITEKDKTIVTLRSNISNKNTQIENLNTQIDSLNLQITELQNDITNKETTISDMQKTVTDLNNKIFELEKKIDYTITYIVGEETTTQTAKGHSTATLLDKPTKTDLTFDGWYYDGNKIETTTFDITNTDISIIGYFKCLVTCGNNTTLVDVGSSLGNNAIIPLGTDGDVYTYYLNGDKTKGYTYDEICSYNFTKNTTITYELTSNTPNIDYSYCGEFGGWDKADMPSPYSNVQSMRFALDKSNNGGVLNVVVGSSTFDASITVLYDEDKGFYFFTSNIYNEIDVFGFFALKRGLSSDGSISTLLNTQNYAWHFAFRGYMGSCIGENFEFNPSLSQLKASLYIFSANLDGTYDTNMA